MFVYTILMFVSSNVDRKNVLVGLFYSIIIKIKQRNWR